MNLLFRRQLLNLHLTFNSRLSTSPHPFILPNTSPAALSPLLTAPSIYPAHRSAVSVPAQCTLPCGARITAPTLDKIPGAGDAI